MRPAVTSPAPLSGTAKFWISNRERYALLNILKDLYLLIMAQLSVRDLPEGVEITGAIATGYDEILTPDALSFVAKLHRTFEARRRECLRRRQDRQEAFDRGELLDFLTETKHIREGDWSCAPIPAI